MMQSRWFFSFLLVAAVTISGCASTPSEMRFHQAESKVVWPQQPDAPRYQYAGFLTGEHNFSTSGDETLGQKMFRWLTGVFYSSAQEKRLKRPSSGWVDPASGRIYVTDIGRHAVFVFDPALGSLDVWESARGLQPFVSPIAIVPGVNDELWVSDADLGAVFRLRADGEPLGEIGAATLQRPTGLAIDSAGERLFVADSKAHRIYVFDAAGSLLQTWGERGEADGQLNAPTHLAFYDDKLYVTDTLNSRVQVFDAHNGEFLSTFGQRGLYMGNMPRPKGVALDGAGRIYVVESYYDYLLVYDAEGRLLLPLGGSGNGIGQFYLPAGVWTDGDSKIYVADMFNGRVVSFEYIGDRGPNPDASQLQ
jgi:DNA-binding beta-propeller fold protein YncE